MATLEALRHYFDSPLQDKSLLDALTALRQMKTISGVDLATFTEIFGELHFKENNPLEDSPQPVVLDDRAPSSSSTSTTARFSSEDDSSPASGVALVDDEARDMVPKTGESFLKNTKNLQMCTEGLGSESGGDLDESPQSSAEGSSSEPLGNQWGNGQRMKDINRRSKYERFPPPISSIGRNGQPWVSFRSYREDGRFVLREIRMPNQEFLHASREDGRLKLRFIQRDDNLQTEEDEEEQEQEVGEETNDDGDDPEMDDAQQAQEEDDGGGGGNEGEKQTSM